MPFHLTMTRTEDNCPGYNREQMLSLVEAAERLPTVAKDLRVTVHSLVWGAPEHVAFALLEAESIGAITQYVNSIPIRQDTRVNVVEPLADVLETGRAMLARMQQK
jgi:hypothetical protein